MILWFVHLHRHGGNAIAQTLALGVCYERRSSYCNVITFAENFRLDVTHLYDMFYPTTVHYAAVT